ncbi:MAG: hypothetical protein K6G08_03275 [Prevotella sp.]|nr:hypothetical protein [Prevotella sp.]
MKKLYLAPALRDLEMLEEEMIAESLGLSDGVIIDDNSKILSRSNDFWEDEED